MRQHLHSASRSALLFVSAVVLVAQTQHITPFTGIWKLNVAKSKFHPGTAPQSVTITVAPDGTFTVEGVDSQGKPMQWSHPWSGGKEVPIHGIENATMLTKVQGRMLDDAMKIGGKTIETTHAVVSPDGKTVTAMVEETDPQGRPVHSVEVYEKQ